jgi:hypothetical protein
LRENRTSRLSERTEAGRKFHLLRLYTREGGEPQGSRKGRPRYPLEGRGEQVDASTQCHIRETQNSGMYVQWRPVDQLRRLSRSGESYLRNPLR